jgi:hypothetical protein
MDQRFENPNYLIRKKMLKLFGGVFHIFGPNGDVVLYSKMKAFKLKEDIRLYEGEDMATELLLITARTVLDISGVYDVTDSTTGERVGALQRKGMKSMLRDEWHILDTNDQQVGTIKEDSMVMAIIRRFVTSLIPQSYSGEVGGVPVFTFKQNFNPFVTKLNLDFSEDANGALDRRLGIAAGVLLCAIEGKQGSY